MRPIVAKGVACCHQCLCLYSISVSALKYGFPVCMALPSDVPGCRSVPMLCQCHCPYICALCAYILIFICIFYSGVPVPMYTSPCPFVYIPMSSAVTCSAFGPFWPFRLPFIASLSSLRSHIVHCIWAHSLYGNLIYNFREEVFPETVKLVSDMDFPELPSSCPFKLETTPNAGRIVVATRYIFHITLTPSLACHRYGPLLSSWRE